MIHEVYQEPISDVRWRLWGPGCIQMHQTHIYIYEIFSNLICSYTCVFIYIVRVHVPLYILSVHYGAPVACEPG